MDSFIKNFSEIGLKDLAEVGGKGASLGELVCKLVPLGLRVPGGFSVTAAAFRHFLEVNGLRDRLRVLLGKLDRKTYQNLSEIGGAARSLLVNAELPDDLKHAISVAYRKLGAGVVAVRSSATVEDLPTASFAGQHDSFLNIMESSEVLTAVRNCFASLYTDRAIKYREDNGFDHGQVALSVAVQQMVSVDNGSSGVAFTLDPETGFRDVIHISGTWGLGENLVQGAITPDEFWVFKPTLQQGYDAVLQRKLGSKEHTLVWANDSLTYNYVTPEERRNQFVLDDNHLLELARWCCHIEDHYGKPMDIEWAVDGNDGLLYILQARPETVQANRNPRIFADYRLGKKGTLLASGQAVGMKVVSGKARIIRTAADRAQLRPGEILVTGQTQPDWDPVLKRAAAIVTDIGGRTSHASIVARELGVPAVVGCGNATGAISDGALITVSCAEGKTRNIYSGAIPYTVVEHDFSNTQLPERTGVKFILNDPDKAFRLSLFPNNGVGLVRLEIIISNQVQVHPMALVRFAELKDDETRRRIGALTHSYQDKKEYFVDKVAQSIAMIAAAFYPKEVIVRTSDFKTNEYAGLTGAAEFEPKEENPMVGFRGASRYYHPLYREAFALECAAIARVRTRMGLENVKVMIPFCRTVAEAETVVSVMAANGLNRSSDPGLELYMMAEIPANVLLADAFATHFDGFSIGSNDLAQLTLGIDRDSALVAPLFSEQNEATRRLIADMIGAAHRNGKKIGLCGLAPGDDPAFVRFLVNEGIDSISFIPGALLTGMAVVRLAEKERKATAAPDQQSRRDAAPVAQKASGGGPF
ncbi:phosphoenolpyruvate synthase [Flaviaesturariibacter flavus]|uniref:Phosphoenolpyruvate synthase n=1 Tax=Flaviaesturariibacter flavus TaxID=2502780 RepID=A0A4R1BPE0_9BACT|nr:phosphoenolpyruvate synthase [Flaviaesturariibacter flavus]TCJ19075.1 phosphoenolpyruvate synthase [Flaviaesturariibacter flavus]